jgi:hypothetical protein
VKTDRGALAPCVSGKVGYASWEEAARDLRDMKAKAAAGLARYAPLRAYFCGRCRYWHLTAREDRAAPSRDDGGEA